ncbi:MAG: YiiX family permuted papain-like enzyme [Bacteroidetes bacterium]|nr:YiiX family permuted papain-like enzyme [Bacteroidota bacterium]
MKKLIIIQIILFPLFSLSQFSGEFKDGDIIFQTSLSSQSQAIQLATHSRYSHVGIIYKKQQEWYVFEAIQPVKSTRLKDWIARGENGEYKVKRLKDFPEGLSTHQINRLIKVGRGLNGRNYDLYFEWSDKNIYCSELVWKLYQRGLGITLCELSELRTFDLTHPVVKNKLKERYGANIPLSEKVVTPEDVYQSDLLMEVRPNIK